MISLELVLKTLCELYRVSIFTCVYVTDAPNFGAMEAIFLSHWIQLGNKIIRFLTFYFSL